MELANTALAPMDSALTPFLDALEFQRQLALLSTGEPEWGSVDRIQTGVLKCHPGRRCAFEVSLQSGNVSHELIGKVYKKERPYVFEVMTAIRRAGFDEHAKFSIPRPLAYVLSQRLLLVTKANGLHAAQVFLEGDSHDREMAAVRSAQWLARFHALTQIPGCVLGPDVVFRRSFKTCERLTKCCPSLASKGQRLLEGLEPALNSLFDIPMAPSHGDFVPAHVFLTDRQVVTVDWDSFVLSDPSRDVARFILGLGRLAERHLGSIRALDPYATLFQETYLAVGEPRVAKNVPFYMAALCLRQAKRYVRRQRSRWQERAEVLLDEGLRALAN
jgi:hypothetical protein